MATLSCPKQSQAVYRPRRPEKTVFYEVTKKHYTTWSKHQEKIPYHISNAFQKYLGCGILAKGFACAHCDGCNKDLLIPFSCKRRGICPSCNQRAMVETAANLIDNLLPRIQYRQWVMSFPRRIRHYLETHKILQAVLKIVIDEIRKTVIANNPTLLKPQIGAISFIQHFGNTLNYHPHFHIILADGLFSSDQGLQFHESSLTQDDIQDTQEQIQKRVLRYFSRRGLFSKESVYEMLAYENSGFSLDAKVTVQSFDEKGLERLIRYCARPPFKSENLRWHGKTVEYTFSKPTHTGKTYMQLDPVDFLDRISKFIPYPRRHRHHFHGVFAPSSPLRGQIASNAQKRLTDTPKAMQEAIEKTKKASKSWAQLISRIYEIDPLSCTGCGKKIKITTFVTQPEHIRRILKGIGWPTDIPEFDPPYDLAVYDICHLLPDTADGFPEPEIQMHYEYVSGHDPPSIDPPHCDNICDPPHWQD